MKQMYENTQESEQDCEDMVQYFQTEFGANESGVTFLAEGNYSECKKVLQEDLSKTLQENSSKNYLILYVFAGHAVQMDGQSALLINEEDKNTRFYKRFQAEKSVRMLANQYPNSYHIAVFACRRDASKKEYYSMSVGEAKPEDEMTEAEQAQRQRR